MRRPRLIHLVAAATMALPVATLAAGAVSAVDGIGTISAALGGDLVADYPFPTDWSTPDGNADMVFSFTLTAAGAHTITRVDIGQPGGWWLSTGGGTIAVVGVVDPGAPATLLNSIPSGSVSVPFTDSIALRLHGLNSWSGFPMPQDGASYVITVWVDETTQYQETYTFAAAPDTTDSSVPDSSVPDSSVPDSSVPDTSTPDSSVPDTSTPDTSPDTAMVTEDDGSSVPEQSPTALPHTGQADRGLLVAGALLVALGAAALAITRRRDIR